jgi:hypothetical protein
MLMNGDAAVTITAGTEAPVTASAASQCQGKHHPVRDELQIPAEGRSGRGA